MDETYKSENAYGIFFALCELLGLPKHITDLELSFTAISETLITCAYELQENDLPKVIDGKIVTETKKYKIVASNIDDSTTNDNFVINMVDILGASLLYTKFKFSMKKDADILIQTEGFLNTFKKKIEKLEEMKTKFNIHLEEI